MRNLRMVLLSASMAGMVLACGFGGAPVAPGDYVATIVAATLNAVTAAPSTSTPTTNDNTLQGTPVTYKNVSFVLPTVLAVDAAPQTVPTVTDENAGPWDASPEHISFRLDKYYAPEGHFSEARIDIYPAQAYADANSGANISLQRLQGVLGNPAGPLTNENLPQVPYFNAASVFAARAKRIPFQSGEGVRLITQYAQGIGPIGNFGTFYHFQGLTTGGKYYIVAVLPITAPFLQSGSDPAASPPAGGIPFPGYDTTDPKILTDYFQMVAGAIDTASADAFTPRMGVLDALVQSITVNP